MTNDDMYNPVPLVYTRPAPHEQRARSEEFLQRMRTRRSIRRFSTEPVPFELIADAVAAAGTAPSGASQQPWTFVRALSSASRMIPIIKIIGV